MLQQPAFNGTIITSDTELPLSFYPVLWFQLSLRVQVKVTHQIHTYTATHTAAKSTRWQEVEQGPRVWQWGVKGGRDKVFFFFWDRTPYTAHPPPPSLSQLEEEDKSPYRSRRREVGLLSLSLPLVTLGFSHVCRKALGLFCGLIRTCFSENCWWFQLDSMACLLCNVSCFVFLATVVFGHISNLETFRVLGLYHIVH